MHGRSSTIKGQVPGLPPKNIRLCVVCVYYDGCEGASQWYFLFSHMYCQTLVFKQAPIRGILHNISSLRYCDLSDTIGYFRQADNTLSLVSSQVETLSTFTAGYL